MKKIEVILEIHSSPERIIEAFTNPAMLRACWDVERKAVARNYIYARTDIKVARIGISIMKLFSWHGPLF